MRIILYTGKGGVGKTSIAAATACRLAKKGSKTLIMSTDQAHSLGDAFELKLTSEPTAVMDNLDAAEIDVVKEGEQAWGSLQKYLEQLLVSKSGAGIEAEELLIFPGLEELFSLFKILDVYEQQEYDVLLVDCAPTGETLSLLKFPELFGNMLDTLMPVKRKVVKAVGPAVEKVTKIPMPKDNVFADIERLMDKLERLQSLMLDKDRVSVRIVTTPEHIVVKEAKRSFTCLQLYDYNVDAVIVNKVYPKEALEGYFNKWTQLQQQGLEELKASFSDIPMFYLELQKQEIKSVPLLSKAADLYRETDPQEVLFKEKIFNIEKGEEKTILKIHLPFADKEELELLEKPDELEIAFRNERRLISLPDTLKGMEIQSARFEEGVLNITFVCAII